MKVKKYTAPTMPEAMNQIRKELGADAVILSSKEIQEGGFLGFFKKKKIEVIAALDPNPLPKKHMTTKVVQTDQIGDKKQKNGIIDAEIINEMKSMRRILEQQSIQGNRSKFAPDYQVIYQYLLDQEIADDISTNIMESIMKKHEKNNISPNQSIIIQDVKREIEAQLNNLSFQGISTSAKVVHFVGPTGVGKTTTLAKVAAKSILQDKRKVAFITMDTYRIAAIEQLKTYAKILDSPVEVVYSLDDYHNAIEKLKDYDLLLVDTAGRNYRDEQYVKELTNNIVDKENVENYLVLSLTAKPRDINDIYHSFRHINIKSVIFTKIDETRQYGSLLNIPLSHQKGIAYITNGQEVPDNIVEPTKEMISNYIVGDLIDS
ncbi:flagellar biosynthesis protein FlhF [Paucisalibacillus globulus]|uniref:flagellar biosynthesis protein FlhF n=1 Tax=Paucisalibacillus globulus TaxID=351095 RepID=UPI0004257C8E|nr:flagellar biosynthesis protein FlhF [Paucisalibacillus globulus]